MKRKRIDHETKKGIFLLVFLEDSSRLKGLPVVGALPPIQRLYILQRRRADSTTGNRMDCFCNPFPKVALPSNVPRRHAIRPVSMICDIFSFLAICSKWVVSSILVRQYSRY